MERSKLYREIKEILEKNKDAEMGFRKAAEHAESSVLRKYFLQNATKRKNFNGRLKSEIRSAYADFDADGFSSGTLYRAWKDVKGLFSADDDESMLEQSIRGDNTVMNTYDNVLEEGNLPIELRKLLTEQKAKIQMHISNHNTLDDLS